VDVGEKMKNKKEWIPISIILGAVLFPIFLYMGFLGFRLLAIDKSISIVRETLVIDSYWEKVKSEEKETSPSRIIREKDFVQCDRCGKWVYKKNATKGKPEIRQRIKEIEDIGMDGDYMEDYIYYPWICDDCWGEDGEELTFKYNHDWPCS
jgi:hypothetical protein